MKLVQKPSTRWSLLVLAFSLFFLCTAAAGADSQSSKDVEVPPSSSGQTSSEQFFRFWFEISPPSQSKKNFDFRPPTTPPKSPSEPQEIRYLLLGNIDPELALIIRLTDKAEGTTDRPHPFCRLPGRPTGPFPELPFAL